MESIQRIPPIDEQLEVERAAAAPYVDYPDLPRWWPVVAGCWFTAVLTPAVADRPEHRALQIALLVVLIGLLGAAVRWYTTQRGVVPSNDPRHAPPEIARLMWAYYGLAATIALVVLACRRWAPPAVTLATTFVLSTVGLTLYDSRYRAAAARARARLS